MNEYMVIVRFISSFNEEFIALLPGQRAQINRLMEKGIITSYSLSADRGTLWVTLLATSLEAVEKTLQMMPLFKFMQYDVVELMFHNSPVHAQMHFSMN
jgi:muconolactone delta-isomerase